MLWRRELADVEVANATCHPPSATQAPGLAIIHPRAGVPREPPFKFAFFNRLSY